MGRNSRLWAWIFAALAVLLSDVMCAVVAFGYADMLWGIRVACYSAPAWVAFLPAIPYGAGILICAALALWFARRGTKAP